MLCYSVKGRGVKKIIIFLGLFVLVGAISIGGHWPSAHGAVVLPRPDLVSQTAPSPSPANVPTVRSKLEPPTTPAPTPAQEPFVTPSPILSAQPTPLPAVGPTPVPVDTPIPSPHPTCPPCGGGQGTGASEIMCPMIACQE